MPTELVRTSPVEYPTATAEPGCSVCGGNVPSGPGGTASTGRPAFAEAVVSALATDGVSPLTLIGATIGFADASAAFIRGERPAAQLAPLAPPFVVRDAAAFVRPGTSTGVPMIASIGVASAAFPPYSLIDSEIAPITRFVPAPSGQ